MHRAVRAAALPLLLALVPFAPEAGAQEGGSPPEEGACPVASGGDAIQPGCTAAIDASALGAAAGEPVTVTQVAYRADADVCGSFAFSGRAVGRSALVCAAAGQVAFATARTSPGDPDGALLATWEPEGGASAALCGFVLEHEDGTVLRTGGCHADANLQPCLPGLWAESAVDGSIVLSWPQPGTAQLLAMRGTGPWAEVAAAATSPATFVPEAGVLYGFTVVVDGPGGGPSCPVHARAFVAEPLACQQVTAVAADDGTVRLTWAEVPGADGYNVYVPGPDGSPVLVGHSATATFEDRRTGEGTQAYEVRATHGATEAEGCRSIEVALVPDFPTAFAFTAASAAAIGGYAWLRRKR